MGTRSRLQLCDITLMEFVDPHLELLVDDGCLIYDVQRRAEVCLFSLTSVQLQHLFVCTSSGVISTHYVAGLLHQSTFHVAVCLFYPSVMAH